MLREHSDLLRTIAYIQLAYGNVQHALAILDLLKVSVPLDDALMRLLAYAYSRTKARPENHALLDKLRQSAKAEDRLLQARLLLATGARAEARSTFKEYLAMKRQRRRDVPTILLRQRHSA